MPLPLEGDATVFSQSKDILLHNDQIRKLIFVLSKFADFTKILPMTLETLGD